MSPAEKRALWALAIVVLGFLPPMTLITGSPEPFVLGVPLNFAWCGVMIVVTSIALGVAYRMVAAEGFPDERGPDGRGEPNDGGEHP